MLLITLLACAPDQELKRITSPPQVQLSAPDALLRQGQGPGLFEGSASDQHDGPMGLALDWTLDEQPLGEPFFDDQALALLSLELDGLALGEHTLTLRATDSDGDSGQASVSFELGGPLGAPTAQILSPLNGDTFEPGEMLILHGLGSDMGTDPAELEFAWDSSLDGFLGDGISEDGESVLFTDTLQVGVHDLSVTVTDPDGQTANDTVSVELLTPPVDAEPGDLVLSELMVNPDVVSDTFGEWFELYNTSGSPINIRGYTLHDLDYDTWVIDVDMVLPPHAYFLLCASTDPAQNGGVHGCDAGFLRPQLPPPGMALGNQGDEVVLVRPDGVEIDRLEYTASWVQTGVSVGVDPRALDEEENNHIGNWCAQTTVLSDGGEPATAGIENDPCW